LRPFGPCPGAAFWVASALSGPLRPRSPQRGLVCWPAPIPLLWYPAFLLRCVLSPSRLSPPRPVRLPPFPAPPLRLAPVAPALSFPLPLLLPPFAPLAPPLCRPCFPGRLFPLPPFPVLPPACPLPGAAAAAPPLPLVPGLGLARVCPVFRRAVPPAPVALGGPLPPRCCPLRASCPSPPGPLLSAPSRPAARAFGVWCRPGSVPLCAPAGPSGPRGPPALPALLSRPLLSFPLALCPPGCRLLPPRFFSPGRFLGCPPRPAPGPPPPPAPSRSFPLLAPPLSFRFFFCLPLAFLVPVFGAVAF